MEKVQLKDINLDKLKKINYQGNSSTIYIDDNKCIKILDRYSEDEKKEIYKKVDKMSSYDFNNVIIPTGIIENNGNFEGYITDYFDGVSIYKKYTSRYIDFKELFDLLYRLSICLENEIHKKDIICLDLNFFNVLVNKNNEFKIVDFDDWIIEKSNPRAVNSLLYIYYLNYRKQKIMIDKNIDKLSMILSLFDVIFTKEVQNISNKNYKYLQKKLNTLKNMRNAYEILKRKNKSLEGNLNYLHEYIDKEDDYVFDRYSLMKKNEILNSPFSYANN